MGRARPVALAGATGLGVLVAVMALAGGPAPSPTQVEATGGSATSVSDGAAVTTGPSGAGTPTGAVVTTAPTPAPAVASTSSVTSTSSAASTTATAPTRNLPSYLGAPWFEPGVPYTQNFPDPDVVVDGSTYVAYATSTGGPTLPAMTSSDLSTWIPRPAYSPNPYNTDPYFADAMPHSPLWSLGGGAVASGQAQWGPGVARIGDHWVAYTAWEVAPGRRCIGAASSASAIGPFDDPSSSPLQCDADPAGSIDASPFVDGDGTPYLIWKSNGVPGSTPTRIWSRRLSSDGMSFAPGSSPVMLLQTALPWEGNVIENPSMVLYGGRYWMIYSANEWASGNYRMGQALCAGPSGPCARASSVPLLDNTASELGRGGGSLFVDTAGRLRLMYAAWNAPYTDYPADPNCDGNGTCTTQGQRYYHVEGLVPWDGVLTDQPIGVLASTEAAAGGVRLVGWSLDPTASDSPVTIRVTLDGAVSTFAASLDRPDVGAAFPGYGTAHGFDQLVAASAGSHRVCVDAVNIGAEATATRLGCATVQVPATRVPGGLDTVRAGAGTVEVVGWALDPSSSRPVLVRLTVDGAGSTVLARDERQDVGAVYPVAGPFHGFDVTLPATAGVHQVCATGVGLLAGGDVVLGCRAVTVG